MKTNTYTPELLLMPLVKPRDPKLLLGTQVTSIVDGIFYGWLEDAAVVFFTKEFCVN